MTENGSIAGNGVSNPLENTEEEIPEVRFLTQEVANEQIKCFLPPLETARGIDSASSKDGDHTASEPLPNGRL